MRLIENNSFLLPRKTLLAAACAALLAGGSYAVAPEAHAQAAVSQDTPACVGGEPARDDVAANECKGRAGAAGAAPAAPEPGAAAEALPEQPTTGPIEGGAACVARERAGMQGEDTIESQCGGAAEDGSIGRALGAPEQDTDTVIPDPHQESPALPRQDQPDT